MQAAIGLDLGGSKLAAGLVLRDGTVVVGRQQPTGSRAEPTPVLAAMYRMAQELLEEAERRGLVVAGVGAGCPGPLDYRQGVILYAPNLPGWREVRVKEFLQQALGLPVYVENDGNAATLGEYYFGAGRGVHHLLYLGLGTGIGSGVIIDGRLLQSGVPGGVEAGHTLVVADGRPCGCGRRGCLEAYFSGRALETQYREITGEAMSAAVICAAAGQGQQPARSLLERAGRYLGLGIGSLLNLLAPQRVVIGGGMLPSWETFAPYVESGLQEYALTEALQKTALVPAALGGRAGVVGAASLAWQ